VIEIPTITTERLVLRAPRAEDYPAYAAMVGSPRAKYMGGPYEGWAAWGMFCHETALWALFGHGGLMIERRADGVCVGVSEINDGPLFPEKELGWMLYEGFEGNGYATEAAIAMRTGALER
jgi:RimJ/RimL family protein N-acetyltransferase